MPEPVIIKDLNLHARPGEMIALVGPTGAGKTTLVNLLSRFYNLDDGEIRIDEVEINQFKQSICANAWGWSCRMPFSSRNR